MAAKRDSSGKFIKGSGKGGLAPDPVTLDIVGFDELFGKIEAARLKMKDLRPLWESFISDFYKDEKRIFKLQGPGRYKDLSSGYKRAKLRLHGFLYPILFATGALAASLTKRNARGSVAVATPQTMILGTRIAYAVYHHSTAPRTKMPRRPLWDEDPKGARAKRWNRIADKYFEKAIQGAFDGKGGSGVKTS